jgi:molybdate transport system substrate-binding protein
MNKPFYTILLLAVILFMAGGASAQLKVMTSGGFSPALHDLLPEFERQTGIQVTTSSGASQGKGPDTIGAQLRAGATVDMVIMAREGLDVLIADGRIVPGTDVDLAETPIGVGIRAGAPKPDMGTVDAFKRALLEAKVIAIPTSTTGIYLTGELLPRLGIADAVTVKSVTRGAASVALVAAGEAVLTMQPVSEILHVPGVELAGPIPKEIQYISVFSAAIVRGSEEQEACKRLIAFLTSENAVASIKKSGMEPAGPR